MIFLKCFETKDGSCHNLYTLLSYNTTGSTMKSYIPLFHLVWYLAVYKYCLIVRFHNAKL